MPQLDQASFIAQVFYFLLAFFLLYTIILTYFVPSIFRILKYRTKKFELLIKQNSFLNSTSTLQDKKYTTFLTSFIGQNNSIFNLYKDNYIDNIKIYQKQSYQKLYLISENNLDQIIFRKINLNEKIN